MPYFPNIHSNDTKKKTEIAFAVHVLCILHRETIAPEKEYWIKLLYYLINIIFIYAQMLFPVSSCKNTCLKFIFQSIYTNSILKKQTTKNAIRKQGWSLTREFYVYC